MIIPDILQFAIVTSNRKRFMRFVTPANPDFVINPKASKKHGIYKEEFLKKDPSKRKGFATVWDEFLDFIESNHFHLTDRFVLCAFNGFRFDFRVLLFHLKEFNIKLPKNTLLVDPWLDRKIIYDLEGSFLFCYFDVFDNTHMDYPHNALGDAERLEKYYKYRTSKFATLVMRLNDYDEFIFAGNPARYIAKKFLVVRCCEFTFLNKCCYKHMRLLRTRYDKKRK